ncbi:MAG: hypothetical protein QOD99_1098 [Chthoniobacter sp.]|nr:hypothetical protein [Chthoniobacter sp.]
MNFLSKIQLSFLALLVLLLTGCAGGPGQPKPLATLYHSYESDRVARYRDPNSPAIAAASTSAGARNDLMNDLILMIDHNYAEIEKRLYGNKSWADFGGSVLATGLGTAGTLSGDLVVKTTLSALVTAIDSTKVSFNKDVLQGQSIIAIIATMRKMRAEKLLEIRLAQKLSIHGYPLSLGLDDLMAYYNAGTFIAALQGMTEDAASGKKNAEERLNSFKVQGVVPVKVAPSHPTGVIEPAATGATSVDPDVPTKLQPSHPIGVVESAQ